MKNLTILNSKQVKHITNILDKQFSSKFRLSDYAVLMNLKNKIYIVNKELFSLSLDRLRVNSIGLYFATMNDDEIRLSVEGSQLVGATAEHNIVELDKEELKQWMQGIDLDKDLPDELNNKFIIIKHKNDFIGCGKVKENKILNYVPKVRRVKID